MNPYIYTQMPGSSVIRFHYRFKDLREWINRGKRYGDTGPLLTKSWVTEEGTRFLEYRTFGTIDHPMTDMCRLTLTHQPAFDGEFNPDKIINPDPPFWLQPGNMRMTIIDFNPET